jgi:hypothetical protein
MAATPPQGAALIPQYEEGSYYTGSPDDRHAPGVGSSVIGHGKCSWILQPAMALATFSVLAVWFVTSPDGVCPIASLGTGSPTSRSAASHMGAPRRVGRDPNNDHRRANRAFKELR